MEPYVTMACFLAREGMDLYGADGVGISPLALCSDDVLSLVTSYISEHKSVNYICIVCVCACACVRGMCVCMCVHACVAS